MKKIAILSVSGSGRKRTLPALKNSDIAKVVAIHGRNQQKVDALGAEWGLDAFSSLNELADAEFDVLYVASPPFLHRDQIEALAYLDKPIICEKPLCVSKPDVDFFRAHFEAKTSFMLAHHLRHQKAIRRIKEIVDTKLLGNVRSALFQWNFPLNKEAPSAIWKLNPKLGGNNPFFDAGIHTIDMAILLFGKPLNIFASGFKGEEEGIYETASALLRFDSCNVTLNASARQSIVGNDLTIYFEKGFLRAPSAFTEKSISEVLVSTEGRETV